MNFLLQETIIFAVLSPCRTLYVFASLLHYALISQTPYDTLNFTTMIIDPLQTMDCLRDGEDLVFLYQLVWGQTDTSYACHVAAMMGLPKELVERGAKVNSIPIPNYCLIFDPFSSKSAPYVYGICMGKYQF